ncbi:hypothetical protein [Streptomyces sp. NPDC059176]|uniref:DUF7144 family membrane protein n=1 Tax=unclassified Streptomyces TaxID=2593676 RepID=UPI0036C6C3CC
MTQQTTHVRSGRDAVAGGFVTFAAVILIVAGILDLFRGIMGIAKDNVFVATPLYVFRFDLTAWGWIHLIFGVIAIVVGFSLFRPATWTRVAGIVIAGLLLIANFLSLPYYPLWSLVAIALCIAVIWALCVVREDDERSPA